jgi:hypothetical protein
VIRSLSDLRAGDVGFGPIGGLAGIGVWLGQGVLGDWSEEDNKVRHVYMITGTDFHPDSPAREAVEAVAGGVRRVDIRDRWTPAYRYIRPAYAGAQQAALAAHHAERMLNVPYNWLNYPALTAHHLHLPVPHLDDWIARTDADGYPRHVICSQHVDAALTLAGFQVFDDGRLPQDVWPSALFNQLLKLGGVYVRPGRQAP